MNELANEKSPYLRQHANNPVHWKPWGQHAFDLAVSRKKPIFLSIGYSTCHWCHVMERESFENSEIADFLNQNFVAVKVDREELPEVDSQYMHAVQIMTRRGGWPMSVFLDHELRPFFGGTYFPAQSFLGLMQKITHLWNTNIAEIHRAGGEMHKILQLREEKATRPGLAELISKYFAVSRMNFDSEKGGHASAPKFPMNYELIAALRLGYGRDEMEASKKMVRLTLDKMLSGGIWDHVGGGIHRYSTDDEWRVPHFEKMLYDQASLLSALSESLAVEWNTFYVRRAEQLLDYLARDMQISKGAFYAAEDADSEGEEGTFYVWTRDELSQHLSDAEIARLRTQFEISDGGNWEGKIVIHASRPERESFDDIWKKLLPIRSERPRPLRDEKVITSWNGLMIGALARYARVTASERALLMARDCAGFIEKFLVADGKLFRRWIDGEVKFEAQLEDYAFMIEGLIELYQASSDRHYLDLALNLQKTTDGLFFDKQIGYVSSIGEHLLRKNQDWADNVTPSAVSTTLQNLIWLGELTLDNELCLKAEKLLEQIPASVAQHPISFPRMLEAIDLVENERETVAAVAAAPLPDTLARHQTIERQYKARRRAIIGLQKEHPLLADKSAAHSPLSYYVCAGKTCAPPRPAY